MPLILDGTKGETFPSWTTATRPATPNTGQTGYNTTLNTLEVYDGTNWRQNYLNSATAQASTSGTSIDFTGIPSWVKRITVMFDGVSTNGTSQPMIQLGDAGGVETTGYTTVSTSITTVANACTAYTNGWQLFSGNAANVIQGNIVLNLITGNIWSGNGIFSTGVPNIIFTSGTKSLSETLTTVRITTAGGTDTFDAGSINILYE